MEIFSSSDKPFYIYIVRLATVRLQQSVRIARRTVFCSRHHDFGHPWQTTTFPVLASVISARSLLMKSLVNRITSRSIQPYRTALPTHPAAPATFMTTSAPCYWCPQFEPSCPTMSVILELWLRSRVHRFKSLFCFCGGQCANCLQRL